MFDNIQIKEIDTTLSQVILHDTQELKKYLNKIITTSDQIFIQNLIAETECLLKKGKNEAKTYHQKVDTFEKLTQSWFDIWKKYKNQPEAIELIKSIDHFTNYLIAYSYLFRSLSYINEGRTGKYQKDLERIILGFSLLSEIVDVFLDFFSNSELEEVYNGATNAISISNRNVIKYFNDGFEISRLITQLRAYSSLIILKIEEHTNNKKFMAKPEPQPWWEKITGRFADSSIYDEAMQLGREYRQSFRDEQ
ncbi:MAG: hypothetical protein ACLFRN_00335 [Halothece sp.]